MARILIKTEGLPIRTMELRMGANRIGRVTEDTEFCIPHKTISSLHCEMVMTNDGVYLRDCESTNGTFLNGVPVTEPLWMQAGNEIRLGDVELLVENVDVHIFIPEYQQAAAAAAAAAVAPQPVVLDDGTVCCPRHPELPVVFRCTNCSEVMCQYCVHILKRQGGAALFLCKLCSQKCERITQPKDAAGKHKKKGLIDTLQETVRFKLGHSKDQPKK